MNLRRSLGKFLAKSSSRLLGTPAKASPFSPQTPPKKILFLGGSNTVMRGGYTEPLLACLADRFGPFEKVTNLSAGANSSVHGLMLAKGIPDLAEYDLIFVEYGVNDVKMAPQESMPIWFAGAEGLLRFLLANRPERPLVYIQFARRDMRPYQYKPARGMRELVKRYAETHRVSIVEIDHLLRKILFPEPEAFKALYSDNAHFQRPMVTTLVGARIAAEVLGTPSLPKVAARLPRPLHRAHFEHARLMSFTADEASDRIFSNSRFTLPTRRLAKGESLELDLPGSLICLEYIATQTSGTLGVEETGAEPFAIHTRHKVNGPKLPFLVKSTPLTWKSWTGTGSTPGRLRLTALAGAGPELLRPENNMIAAEAKASGGVYLSRLLCLS